MRLSGKLAVLLSLTTVIAVILVLLVVGVYGKATEDYPTWFSCGQDEYVYYVAQEWPPSLADSEAACDPAVPKPDPPEGEWLEGKTIYERRGRYP